MLSLSSLISSSDWNWASCASISSFLVGSIGSWFFICVTRSDMNASLPSADCGAPESESGSCELMPGICMGFPAVFQA